MKLNYIIIVFFFFFVGCDADEEEVQPNFYDFEINIAPADGGRVEVYDEYEDSQIISADSIIEGAKIRLKAIANDGYSFSGFWGNGKYLPEEEPIIIVERDNVIKATFRSESGTPVAAYGDLAINGTDIVDSNGIPIQLRGMSFFWSQWIGKYYNADVVKWLAVDWEASVVRASMGVDESGGYIYNRTERNKVETVVEAAIDNGIYVIIDWHSHHAEDYQDEAVEFFSQMAEKYGSYPNVIYEIYNEPLSVSWDNTIKPYAESVIDGIRLKDPDNIIIVGTSRWSQNVDDVIGNKIDGENIAYGFHFYASEYSHLQNLPEKATSAIEAGVPLFVTEWGVSEASGNGNFNKTWTKEWIDFMDEHKLSWCNWSVADKAETSASLLPGANAHGEWKNSELSESGLYIRELLRGYQGYSKP